MTKRHRHSIVSLLSIALLPSALATAGSERGAELYKAVSNGDTKKVTKLIEKGADVGYAEGRQGWTALHLAAHNGHGEIAKLLIDAGADLSATEQRGWTALHLASYGGHAQVVEALLAGSASVGVQTEKGFTPLDLAAKGKHAEIAALLASRGGRGENLGPTLYNAAATGRLEEVGQLLTQGASVGFRAPDDHTPLHIASYGGHLEVVSVLLIAGADPHAVARSHTPLSLAVQEGHPAVVSALIEAGAKVQFEIVAGHTVAPLNIAADRGHVEVVQILLEAGADPNGLPDETAPIVYAVKNGHGATVTALVEGGARVDPPEGWVLGSALHAAARGDRPEMVRMLLGYGARSDVTNYKQETPLDIARQDGSAEVVALLESASDRKP